MAKISCDKSVGLGLGFRKDCALTRLLLLNGLSVKDNQRLVRSWSQTGEKLVGSTEKDLCRRQRLVMEEALFKGEVCDSHIYSHILYWLSVLPLPILVNLQRAMFCFIWVRIGLPKELYEILVGRDARDDSIEKLNVMRVEDRLLRQWAPAIRCLIYDKASLSWRMICNVRCVG